ncbi:hypothetical protein AAFF_G00132140, partial [Aldrovandia affinis]
REQRQTEGKQPLTNFFQKKEGPVVVAESEQEEEDDGGEESKENEVFLGSSPDCNTMSMCDTDSSPDLEVLRDRGQHIKGRHSRWKKGENVDVPSQLINTQDDLVEKDLTRFRFHLTQNLLEGFPHIPRGQLEKKDLTGTIEKMVVTYGHQRALEITLHILRKMKQNDLADTLEETCRQSKDISVYCEET